MATGGMLVIIGFACVAFALLAMRGLRQQPGKPEPAWTNTEAKASAIALSLILLLLAGGSFIVKGMLTL